MLQEMLEFARAPRVLITPGDVRAPGGGERCSATRAYGRRAPDRLASDGSSNRQPLLGTQPAAGQLEQSDAARRYFRFERGLYAFERRDPFAGCVLDFDRKRRAVPEDFRNRFAPIDPDFAIELVSPSDSLGEVRIKVRDYVACNVRLTWIINPNSRTVEIYRPDAPSETVAEASSVSGGPELPGFVLDLRPIFDGLKQTLTVRGMALRWVTPHLHNSTRLRPTKRPRAETRG